MRINVLRILHCLLVAAAIGCCVEAGIVLRDVHYTLSSIPAQTAAIGAALARKTDAAAATVTAQITGLHTDANAQLNALRSDASNRLDDLTGQVADAIAVANTAETDANARLTDALNQTAPVAAAATGALHSIDSAASQIDKALPDYLDCDVSADGIGNPTCLYRRYADISSDLDRAIQTIAGETPKATKDFDAIATDVHREADQIVAPPTLWQKLKAILFLLGSALIKALM